MCGGSSLGSMKGSARDNSPFGSSRSSTLTGVRRGKRVGAWVPNRDVNVSVLAWQAVRPTIRKRSSLSALFGVLTGGGGATGGMGLGTGHKLFTGAAADSVMRAEQSA